MIAASSIAPPSWPTFDGQGDDLDAVVVDHPAHGDDVSRPPLYASTTRFAIVVSSSL